MKLPRKPPEFKQTFKDTESIKTFLYNLMEYTELDDPYKFNNTSKYIHWDKLIRYKPPINISHEEWWLMLKNNRTQNRKLISLKDKKGNSFNFVANNYINEELHKIDLTLGGTIGSTDVGLLNPATKEQYFVRSLIEEAITSSQLEGATTTRLVAKKIIRTGKKPSDRSERMIVNNYKTMVAIHKLKNEKLSKELIFDLHKKVTQGTLEITGAEGRFRKSDEPIKITDQYGTIYHEPPLSSELENRMEIMCNFANNSQGDFFVHPVLKAIILHFWLAYEHPFVDGNGRTARALFYWSMLNQGYWLCEYISISEIILKGPAKYIKAFLYTETDDNDLTYFIIYHLGVVKRSITALQDYIKKKQAEVKDTEKELREIRLFNHRQRALVSHALRHPGYEYSMKSHMISHDIAYETARSDLNELVEKGLLQSQKISNTWTYSPVTDIQDKLKGLRWRDF